MTVPCNLPMCHKKNKLMSYMSIAFLGVRPQQSYQIISRPKNFQKGTSAHVMGKPPKSKSQSDIGLAFG